MTGMKLGFVLVLVLALPGCGPAALRGRGAGGAAGRWTAAGGGGTGSGWIAGRGATGGSGGIAGRGGAAGTDLAGADAAVDAAQTDAAKPKDAAGGGNGGHGSVDPLCQTNTTFDRSCESDGDCVAGLQNGCVYTYVGLRATELGRFQTYQQQCNPAPPHSTGGCDFGSVSPETDDGSPIGGAAAVAVTCRAGTCTTYSSLCGKVCDRGTACLSCPTVEGPRFAACTSVCSTFSACRDPAFPSCQMTLSNTTTPYLCVPEGVVCKLCDSCPPPVDAGAARDAH